MMKRRLNYWLAATAAASLFVALPAAAGERLVVVELFTSQGCSSCPPADAHLADLAKRAGVMALSFHVDYWDYIGWQDRFADPTYTQRQRDYAHNLGMTYIYTPQMVVDGIWHGAGADRRAVAGRMEMAPNAAREWLDVELELAGQNELRIRLPESEGVREANVYFVRWDDGHATTVTRGENKGRELLNANVVRKLLNVGTWRGKSLDIMVKLADLDGAGTDGCAVIVQEPGPGAVIGAARLDIGPMR